MNVQTVIRFSRTNLCCTQTGVVSVLLENGKPSDRYDFLDLYLERWTKEANKVHRDCFGEDTARKLEAELRAANEDLEDDFKDQEGRNLEEDYELHDPQHQDDTSVPRSVSKEYYDRDWHPYDWYTKTNTEVRTKQVVSCYLAQRPFVFSITFDTKDH